MSDSNKTENNWTDLAECIEVDEIELLLEKGSKLFPGLESPSNRQQHVFEHIFFLLLDKKLTELFSARFTPHLLNQLGSLTVYQISNNKP